MDSGCEKDLTNVSPFDGRGDPVGVIFFRVLSVLQKMPV